MDVLGGIQNPAERAAVAMDLFGKAGQGMINMAQEGSGAIRGEMADASRLGSALSGIDSAKVVEAHGSLLKLQMAGEGFANLVVAKLSPFITELATQYEEWGYSGQKSASFITQGVDWITKGLGFAVDGVNVLTSAFHGVNAVVAEMVSYFLSGIEKMLGAIDWMAKKFGKESALGGSMKELIDAWDVVGGKEYESMTRAWANVGKGHETVRNYVDDIQSRATERASTADKKASGFTTPGMISSAPETPKFAGAAELGSKEAYSSILRTLYRGQGESEQKKIAAATQPHCRRDGRMALILQAMSQGMNGQRPLTPHLPASF